MSGELVTTNIAEFQRVMKRWTVNSSRELAGAINSRMFFVLLRGFTLLPPSNPQAQRDKVKAYMKQTVPYKAKGENRAHPAKLVYLIAQARNRTRPLLPGEKAVVGLRGAEMKKAAAKVRARAVGSVGYMKSVIVKGMRAINGHFTQFGRKAKKSGSKGVSSNAALARITAEYGIENESNVGIHKGAKAFARPALPGLNPLAIMDGSIGLGEGQEALVNSEYNRAFARAFDDERAEMERHLLEAVESAAEDAIDVTGT